MAAATLFSDQTADGQSATATVSANEETLLFWGEFDGCSVDIQLQAETGTWINSRTITGPIAIQLPYEATWTFRLNLRRAGSATSVSAQFGPPTV